METARHQKTEVNSESFTLPFSFPYQKKHQEWLHFSCLWPESGILQLSGWSRTLNLAATWEWIRVEVLFSLFDWTQPGDHISMGVTVGRVGTVHSTISTWCPECHLNNQFSSVWSLSRVWLFATPWIAARQASLSITISRSSLKLMSIESVMPSSHLILCRPLLLLPPIPPSIRVFSNESTLCMSWPKYWSFSFSITFTFHFHALEKAMATHSSVLAWRIPGTMEPGGLPSMGSHRVGHDWSDLAAAANIMHIQLKHTHSYFGKLRGKPFPKLRKTSKARKHDAYIRGSKGAHGCHMFSCFRFAAHP